jgi:hypothetical protein
MFVKFNSIFRNPDNKPYFVKMYVHAVMMIILPLVTYLAVKYLIVPAFGVVDAYSATLYAGIAAIVVVKGISTTYLISAFKEGDAERKKEKPE